MNSLFPKFPQKGKNITSDEQAKTDWLKTSENIYDNTT